MDVSVKESKIEGKGVFAERDFKKGEVVLKWDTKNLLTEDEVAKMPPDERSYVSYFKGKYILMQEPERYVNHACEANTYAKDFADVALRDIKKGEEITADYTDEHLPGVGIQCKCGSVSCRGIIIIPTPK